MKSSERHRLKENELSHVLGDATARLQENRSTFGLAAGIVALVLVAGVGYWAWTTRSENRAQALLGDAIVIMQAPVEEPKPGAKPGATSYPTMQARAEAALAKFTEVYNAYPSTDAGIAARYYAASALAMLGRPARPRRAFRKPSIARGRTASTAAWRGSASSRPMPRRRNTTKRSARRRRSSTTRATTRFRATRC